MHDYIDGFDGKVGTKASEACRDLDQRLARFQEALDSRTQTLNDARTSRVMDIVEDPRRRRQGGRHRARPPH